MRKIKAEFHVHTKYSYDCSTSFRDLIQRCIRGRIDVLAVTDHNQIEGAIRLQKLAPFKVIVGEEVLTREGEVIGLFLRKYIPSNLSMKETISRIKRQGGIVYIPHPFDATTRKVSIYKNHMDQNLDQIDIIEIFNGRTLKPWDNYKAKAFARETGKIACIGSDAHTQYELGRNYVYMDDFSRPDDFLRSLAKAEFKKSLVIPWVFLLTKYHRFWKRGLKKKIVLPIKHTCDLCGNSKFTIVYPKRGKARKNYLITDDSYGTHLQMIKCLDCGLIFSFPRNHDQKLIKRYVEFEDPDYEKERATRSKNHARLLEKIGNLSQNRRKLLDVGCATGALLETARQSGWDGIGVELSAWAAKIGVKKYGLNIIQSTLGKARLKNGSCDVVTCIDVIEHVLSPRALLAKIHHVLKPGGVLCIVTPDIGSLVAKVLGEKWWHIRPDHIYFFTEETLTLLLLSLGYRIEKVTKYSWTFSLGYWASRLRIKVPLAKLPLTLNFHDSLEVYARRV